MLDKSAILEAVHCVLKQAMTINNKSNSWIRTQADLFFGKQQGFLQWKMFELIISFLPTQLLAIAYVEIP